MPLTISLEEITDRMVDSLLEVAESGGVSIADLHTLEDVNYLDNLFHDGGEVRCERFADLGWEYANQFGEFDSDPWHQAHWRTIERATQKLRKRTKEKKLKATTAPRAARLGISPDKFRRLITLVNRAAKAQEEHHNKGGIDLSVACDVAISAVERTAARHGFSCQWPGLYPVLVKGGETFHIFD